MMKNINKIKIIAVAFMVIIILTIACKEEFLDVNPTGSLTESQLTSAPGLEGALVASYSYLLGRSGFYSDVSNWFWGSVRGGDANKGSNAGDQAQVNEILRYKTQTNNASVRQKYQAAYEGVARSNATLRLIKLSNIAEAVKTRIEGESKFLRALYYFELKKNFNDVPYVDEEWDGGAVTNNEDLWGFIEADLDFAYKNLPETQSDVGRANKWAARALQGKTFLYQGKWAEAKGAFDEVITKGKTSKGEAYALLEDYKDNFRATFDNSSESVFSVQAAAGTGSVNNANPAQVLNFPHGSGKPDKPGECCGFFQPSFDLANSYRVDGEGLPLFNDTYNNTGNALKTDLGKSTDDAFTPDTASVDPRLDHTIGRRGIPYLDWGPHPGAIWIRDQAHGGPYSPKKYSYYKEGVGSENDGSSWTPGYTTVNYDVIRYADVLLMAAEAEIELTNLSRAMELINVVRERAKNSPVLNAAKNNAANYNVGLYTAFANQETARRAVRFERKLELGMEGHRMYDLVRYDRNDANFNIKTVIDAFVANELQILTEQYGGTEFTKGRDEYLPIPQIEIDLQNEGDDIVIIQNPGY